MIKKALEIQEDIINGEYKNVVNEVKDTTIKLAIANNKCKGIDFDFDNRRITFKLGRNEDTPEKITAYQQLFELINQQAITLRYASAKAKDTDNEKFTFRVWIIRLGMIGDEYKETRKILLQNLTGNSAFRYGKPEKETIAGE